MYREHEHVAPICEAICGMCLVSFVYKGRVRTVEPHACGVSSLDHDILRGYQVDGGEIDWRTYTLSNMSQFVMLPTTFPRPRPGYRRNDSDMKRIHCQL